jgi:UDP:flavonoid glycosyltransferase YjiC (YdhE family)
MKKICIISGPALGHVSRQLVVAEALARDEAYDVTFIVPDNGKESFIDLIPRAGFKCMALPGHVMKGARYRAFADMVEPVLADLKPDALLYDLNPALWLSALNTGGLPRFYLTNVFNTPVEPDPKSMDRFFESNREEIARERKTRGLPEIGAASDLWADDQVLLLDPPEIIGCYDELPAHYHACGPVYWSKKERLKKRFKEADNLLLLSMGSTGRSLASDALISALSDRFGCDMTLYIGPHHPEFRALNSVDAAMRFAPLDKLAKRAALIVSQGGAGSTYQALAAGAPVFVLPTHPTQEKLGELIQRLGLGILGGEGFEPAELSDISADAIRGRVADYARTSGKIRGADGVRAQIDGYFGTA